MSLLLDALKKAAQEKLNNENEVGDAEAALEQDIREQDTSAINQTDISALHNNNNSDELSAEVTDLPAVESDRTEIEMTDLSVLQNNQTSIAEQDDSAYSSDSDLTESVNHTEFANTGFQAEQKTDVPLELEPVAKEDIGELDAELTDIDGTSLFESDEQHHVSTTQLDRFLSGEATDFKNREIESESDSNEADDANGADSASQQTYAASLTQNFQAAESDYFSGSPQKASQVFGAKAKPKDNSRLYLLIGLAVIGILIVGGMFTYDYISQLNQSTMIASPPRARSTIPRSELVSANREEKVDASLLVEQEDYSDIFKDTIEGYEDEADVEAANDDEAAAEKLANTNAIKPKPKRTIASQAGQYSINRRQKIKQEPLQDILMRGYTAYNRGDIQTAEISYQQALTRSPRNRDALLGMAATNVVRGKTDEARRYYRQLLSLNPKDDVALASLAGLSKQQNQLPVSTNELSSIKSMLSEKPESPYLHFTLGNLYAGQQRWPEAQQAYFDAYRLEADNPDYAFNLAVSLEHIGQAKIAIQFYQKALALADNGRAHFSLESVNSRIQALGK